MLEAVRLVVWDLDETFWKGTVTEGGIEYLARNHDIVVELARRGIMSSICSKNDHDVIRSIFSDKGIWEYFIFPSIDWRPKGPRLQELIENVQLRPATVLFIDDNHGNRAEAKAFVPEIQIADQYFLENLLEDARFKGKRDPSLSRLKQYQLLQEKQHQKVEYGDDNLNFLRDSQIEVSIEYDIEVHVDRVVELINRTNQLNFTKIRLPNDVDAAKAEILHWLGGHDCRAGLVSVKDKFGDYGFVGFYLMLGVWGNTKLVHYVFSCRALGMGVEQWLYARLGRPPIEVVGEVLSDLDFGDEPDWINAAVNGGPTALNPDVESELRGWDGTVRIRGACELEILDHMFRLHSPSVACEVTFFRTRQSIWLSHSALLWQALQPRSDEIAEALQRIGLTQAEISSHFLDGCEDGSLLIYSPSADAQWGFYKHKELRLQVPVCYDGFVHHVTDVSNDEFEAYAKRFQFSPAEKSTFFQIQNELNTNYDGFSNVPAYVDIYTTIFDSAPKNALLVILLPNYLLIDGAGNRQEYIYQRMLNDEIERLAANYDNIKALKISEFILSDKNIKGWYHHFDRSVYNKMYNSICLLHRAWLEKVTRKTGVRGVCGGQ